MPAEDLLQPAGKLTPVDVIRFSYFHYLRRLGVVIAFFILFSFFGIAAVLSTGDPERLQNPGSSYFLILLLALLQFGLPYVSARRQYAKLQHLRESMRFQITSERIRLEGPSFSGEMAWPLVHSIYETKNAFLIYQTSQIAWILPKRFFGGEDHVIQRWRQLAIEHLKGPKHFHRVGRLGAWF